MLETRLCLNMIVKNEASIIERCLESVAPHISCWVILDTGSDDKTTQLIEKFFRERRLPGRCYHEDFIDFGASRNRALKLCRQSDFEFDYVLKPAM